MYYQGESEAVIGFSEERCQTKITELQHQSEWIITEVKERIEWCSFRNYRTNNRSKEKEYVKKRKHLIKKYENLTKWNKIQEIAGNQSLLKPAILNLTKQEVNQHQLEPNLGPKFVPSNKKPPFMDIVNTSEICALSFEKENQIENAEVLRQKISNVISKNTHFKIGCNLTFEQRAALQ